MKSIRETLSQRMREIGVKNRAVCTDLNIREQNFSAFINGRRALPYDDLEKVCMYLGLTMSTKTGITEEARKEDAQC